MVSKRRSTNDNEAGSSKKKIKADEKIKTEETPSSPPKKRVKKQKVAKENLEENIASEAASDTSDDEVIDVKQEIPEEFNITEMTTKSNQLNSDLPDWPVEHMSELLRRLEDALPVHEQLTYKSRIEKINWNEIAFENYSGPECRLMWDAIQKRVRRYRILKELIEDAKMWVSKPWTNFYRGPKTNRHPDHPRRPLSTYMIFYLKKKDKVLQENPGLDMTELSKHIAEMYKKLSVKSKFKYKEMAAEQRREYEEKMKEFSRLHPELVRTTTKKEKRVATTAHDNAPSKPLTPFKLFYEDKLKRVDNEENFDEGAFKEKCKGQWRNMSEKKKVFWINWSLDKEAKYQEEMKKYVAENPNFVPVAFKSVVTKEERCIKERMAGKPEKPPNSAYSLFSRLMLVSEDVKRVTPKERMLLIAQQWRNCTEAEKKEYGDRVKHMLDQYKLQYAEYLESLPEEERQTELLKNQPKKRVTAAKPKIIKIETVNKKKKKKVNTPKLKKKLATITSNKKQSKNSNLYEGEPEPPPTTPYLLFVKSYQASYPDRNDAQETWENMTEDQRSFHRQVLWDLKKVYIESYENFLKGLTQEELKEYSEWKKTAKLTQDSASSDEESSASDAECSANSESDNEEMRIKTEDPDDSDTSD